MSGLPWKLWGRQVATLVRIDVRHFFLGGRSLALYFLALLPVGILTLRAILLPMSGFEVSTGHSASEFAMVFRSLILSLVVFFGCVALFANAMRRSILERTLHYSFLLPARREVLVVGKLASGIVCGALLFGASTAVSFFLAMVPAGGAAVQDFFLYGPGLSQLMSYLGVTVLGVAGYGAVLLALGLYFKRPTVPALALFGWESIQFLLPPFLKKLSVSHYLISLCPVPVSEGPFALLTEQTTALSAITGLGLLSLAVVALAAWKMRGMEILYGED